MGNDVEKAERIINKFVKKSFPILKGKRFYVRDFKSKEASGGAFWYLPFLRVFYINFSRNFKDNELMGLIAHELSHFETYQKRGWVKQAFLTIFYFISPKFNRKEEVETDKISIRKGYGRYNYAIALKLKKVKKKMAKSYLTPEEIKSYAKSIKKW